MSVNVIVASYSYTLDGYKYNTEFCNAIVINTNSNLFLSFMLYMKYTAEERPLSEWMDTEFRAVDFGNKILTCMFFGPNMLKSKFYQLCSPEDYTLAMYLVRVSSLFLEDLRLEEPFSKARYGSVDAVYIVCSEDLAIPQDYQQSMINSSNILLKQVKTIKTDHMAMLSAPQELTNFLIEIANNYS